MVKSGYRIRFSDRLPAATRPPARSQPSLVDIIFSFGSGSYSKNPVH
ncbi:unnamed protein product [Penicillium camemberti]|uniref:Str. FM013 n=1 Tax=Penicillium camemberti (strain FM 013) TaxID=1429867 RepID=A0A0G4P775_PENC3|nr:unnamed protein product [Penicillium camemberti]